MIAPHESKIVWYHLRDLPKISPSDTPKARTPRAREVSKSTMISDPNPPKPEKVLIRTPEEVTPPDRQIAPPNMIAIERKKDPPLPIPLPAPNAGGQPEAVIRPDPPKPSPKPFVAPELPAVTRRSAVAPGMLPAPEPSTGLPSPISGAGGASEVNALVLNLLPPQTHSAAAGNRTEVSSGPNTTIPGGEAGGARLRIGGITVSPEAHEAKPAAALPRAEPASRPPLLTSVAPLQNTLSAPLPPSSRTIPQTIEGNFRGRVVYAMVVPMRKVPGYAGDWTIWFADHQAEAGGGAMGQMRAPLPVRKKASLDAEEAWVPGRVQLRAIIDKNGRVDSITIIGKLPPSGGEFAVADLKAWDFLPALRNREAVDVDVVIEIPYAGPSGSALAPSGTGTSSH